MAVSGSILEANKVNTASSATTASAASGASGNLILIWVYNRQPSGTAVTPTLTGTNGFNVTWTQVQTGLVSGDAGRRLSLFRGVSSSTTAGTVTISCGGTSQDVISWSWVDYSGVNTTTSQGIVQSVLNNPDPSATTGTCTLAAFGSVNNATGFGCAPVLDRTLTAKSGYTDGAAYQKNDLVGSIASEWIVSNDTTPNMTWTNACQYLAIGVELAAAAATTFIAAKPFIVSQAVTIASAS